MRDPASPLGERLRRDQPPTSVIVLAELRFGVLRSGSQRLARRLIEVMRPLEVIAFEPPAEARYAEVRLHLQRRGELIGSNDMLIAAHALALDMTLVTANQREFERVPGLRVENWLR